MKHPQEDPSATSPTPYALVTALTQERKLRHLTQADLAQLAGLSRMTVQRLESNGLDPRLSTLQEMARVLQQEIVLVPRELQAAFESWLEKQQGK